MNSMNLKVTPKVLLFFCQSFQKVSESFRMDFKRFRAFQGVAERFFWNLMRLWGAFK